MPDPPTIVIWLVLGAGIVAWVAGPLLGSRKGDAPRVTGPAGDDLATLALRHRIAVETLRDVEADHRAGSLDDASYAELRREAEEHSAGTLAEVEAARRAGTPEVVDSGTGRPGRTSAGGWTTRPIALVIGAALAVLIVAGLAAPQPFSLANATVVDHALAAVQAVERDRQAEIARLRDQLVSQPNDAATIIRLAGLYQQGGTAADLRTSAQLLIFAIRLDPRGTEAYRLLITAYISAGDYTDAAAATDSYAKVAASSPDIPFFRGLIALNGAGDRAAAVRWFDAFLAAAPGDPRAVMVRSLRAEAAGALPTPR
jgi:cytochrome c-type biogenesis protein CcmH/NrfG